jgi:hypothetical protein
LLLLLQLVLLALRKRGAGSCSYRYEVRGKWVCAHKRKRELGLTERVNHKRDQVQQVHVLQLDILAQLLIQLLEAAGLRVHLLYGLAQLILHSRCRTAGRLRSLACSWSAPRPIALGACAGPPVLLLLLRAPLLVCCYARGLWRLCAS